MAGERIEPAQTSRIAAAYRGFALEAARGRSPRYNALAQGIAGGADLLAFLAALPATKRQPNLLVAAVRYQFRMPCGFRAIALRCLAGRSAAGCSRDRRARWQAAGAGLVSDVGERPAGGLGRPARRIAVLDRRPAAR